jgi:hypothetical protein
MAVDKKLLDPTGSGSRGLKNLGVYGDGTVAQATLTAAHYFDGIADELARVGALLIFASDKTFMAKVSISAGVVTLAAVDAYA